MVTASQNSHGEKNGGKKDQITQQKDRGGEGIFLEAPKMNPTIDSQTGFFQPSPSAKKALALLISFPFSRGDGESYPFIYMNLFYIQGEKPKNMKGTVKWFNPRKGFGFLSGEDGKDVFVHHTAIPEGVFLNEGDQVEYEIKETEKGTQAVNVTKL